MATAHVQTKTAHTSSATSLGVSLTGVVSANHLVFGTMGFHSGGPTLQAPTSSPTATWTSTLAQITQGTDAMRVDHSENVASGSWTVTAHVAASDAITAMCSESSGVATSSSKGATNSGTSGTNGTTLATGSITPTSGSILYAWTLPDKNTSDTGASTIDNSFSVASDPGGGSSTCWDSVVWIPAGNAYKANVAASAVNPTWTASVTCGTQISAITEFLAPGGAAQDTPELRGRPEGLRGQNQMQQLLAV